MTTLLQDVVAQPAITNPLFLAITERLSPSERTRAGLRAALTVIVILGIGVLRLREPSS
jgi:hypothetical protein